MSWIRFRVGTASESINQSNIPLQVKLLLKVVAMAMSLYLSGMFEFSPVSSNPIHTLTSSLQLDSEGTKKVHIKGLLVIFTESGRRYVRDVHI